MKISPGFNPYPSFLLNCSRTKLKLYPMSYVKIWLHCVWSTKNRGCIISNTLRPSLLRHIRENAELKSIGLDYINAHEDHVHALINLKKEQNIAEIMQLIKGESSFWINKTRQVNDHFVWQDDYFAASVSHSHVERVRAYIKNQDTHHKKITREEELNLFLEKYGFERIKG
jgi:putative transposase